MEKLEDAKETFIFVNKKYKDEIKIYRYTFKNSNLWKTEFINTIKSNIVKVTTDVEREWGIYCWYLRFKVKFQLIAQPEFTSTHIFETMSLLSYYPWQTEGLYESTYGGLLSQIKEYTKMYKCNIKNSIYLEFRAVKDMIESDSDDELHV